ncbi:uncharacterized protein JN550_008526 [Neoarthrinium moseri]|uniref:uncharacterized protein n=1 Tax=Neoarthrinium moseri TaxID=1658444 RepID=UPI001FDDE8A0|nr:uncharacterized protein JN550_008526 [Neoarthrinium moseri]KAI1864980.1 hypothetical protein JN550_008526 [Neoarthrinium moseri]
MIEDEFKYFCLSGDIPVGESSTWHVTDWDQRRVVSVTMDGEQDDDSIAIKHYSRYSSQLSRDIYRIHVSHTGEIISTYTDPENDPTCCVHYPFRHEVFLPEGIQTVRRDELEELDRLGPDVDLVAYPPCLGGSAKKVVFKYYFLWQYAQWSWKEMNLWMRLPRHPNIVPFDRVVVDELEGRVVGFTNIYVPGGSLQQNQSRVFRLEWLQQLIRVVDELNLRYGIAHQDIAPRNLVVDESTDSIMLFDFNFAARIHRPSPGEEWVKHPGVKLNHPVASYQLILQEWRERRAGALYAAHPGDVPEAIDWPSMPKPPQKTETFMDAHGQASYMTVEDWDESRQDVRDRGGKVLNWERPPQRLLDSGTRVLSTGEVINC